MVTRSRRGGSHRSTPAPPDLGPFPTPGRGVDPRGYQRRAEKGVDMLAEMGLGLIGTILVIVVVIAAIMFFVRRA